MGQVQRWSGEISFRQRASGHIRGWELRSVLILLTALSVASCAGDPKKFATVEAFRDTRRIEAQLQKGVSTKDDVKRILGEPTGSGAVFMARVQRKPQEMWFYQDIELTDIQGSKGQIDLKMRQQILIVILRDGTFDGFMWFSNEEAATGWVKDILLGNAGR